MVPIVGSWFSNWAHYDEFVESESKSWALIRRRLFLGVKNTQNRAAQRPREKGPLARGREPPTPLVPQEPISFFWASFLLLAVAPFSFVRSLLLYILLLRSSSTYTSMPILKCTSHQPLFLVLCELLWPPSPCPGGHIHINGVRLLAMGI